MRENNRVDLEQEIYIYQRADVKAPRWYAAIKLVGVARRHIPLGVMPQAQAAKEARQLLLTTETNVKKFGKRFLLRKNTVGAAYLWFKENQQPSKQKKLSAGRYRVIMSAWDTHILDFLGRKTPIDGRLAAKFAEYPKFRKRYKDKRTKERYRYARATLRNEIGHAAQLLKIARLRAGIGEDVGDLKMDIPDNEYSGGKSKSVGLSEKDKENIFKAFDEETEVIKQKMIDDSSKKGLWDYHLFLHERLRFFWCLALATGARVNELRQVLHDDLLNGGFKTLRIRKSKTIKGTNRHAYIDNEICDVRQAYERFMKYCETGNTRKGLVFKNRNQKSGKYYIRARSEKGKLPVFRIGNTLKNFLRKYDLLLGGEGKEGMYPINFYSSRHHFATTQVVKGVSPYALSASMGTSQSQIEKTYYDATAGNTLAMFEFDIEADKDKKKRAMRERARAVGMKRIK